MLAHGRKRDFIRKLFRRDSSRGSSALAEPESEVAAVQLEGLDAVTTAPVATVPAPIVTEPGTSSPPAPSPPLPLVQPATTHPSQALAATNTEDISSPAEADEFQVAMESRAILEELDALHASRSFDTLFQKLSERDDTTELALAWRFARAHHDLADSLPESEKARKEQLIRAGLEVAEDALARAEECEEVRFNYFAPSLGFGSHHREVAVGTELNDLIYLDPCTPVRYINGLCSTNHAGFHNLVSSPLPLNPHCVQECALCYKWVGILLGALGSYLPPKEKVANAFRIKQSLEAAAAARPNDSSVMLALGEWCFKVAGIGWVEANAAKMLFGQAPQSTYDEALDYYDRSWAAKPSKKAAYKASLTCTKLARQDDAQSWLERAAKLPGKGAADAEIDRLVAQARRR